MALEVIPFREKVPAYEELWPKLKLSSEHAQLWAETRTAAIWALPFVTDVWYNMMVDDDGQTAWFTDQVPIAATDDTFMFINPGTFFKFTLEERVFVCAHEVFHCVFNHCGLMWQWREAGEIRYPDGLALPYDHKLMNIAADCVINALLIKSNVGGMPKEGQLSNRVSASDTIAMAYRKLYEDQPFSSPNPSGSGGKNGRGGFDEHLRPGQGRGKSPTTAEAERNPQQWINAVNAAKASALAAGNLPAAMDQAFTRVMTADVDWLELYPTTVSKALGRDLLSWTYLDPEYAIRGIGFPGKVRFGCGLIVIIFDTSGSINQTTLDLFAGVTQGVIETVKPQLLIVGECDTKIYRWEEIQDISDLKGKITGRGGTSFHEPFNRVAAEGLEPELLIYLTDLEGQAPTTPPPYSVIWACTTDNKGPWGTTIKIPKQQERQ